MKRLVALLPVLIAFQAGAPPALAWTWPVDGPVLRPFSLGDDPYAAGQHRGIDVAAASGSPVRAPVAGSVSFAGTVPGGGRTVTLLTEDGYAVTLVHLGGIATARGAPVVEGAVVGTIGPSGDAEHPQGYIHLGVRAADDPNGYLDPLGLLPVREVAPPVADLVEGTDSPKEPAPTPDPVTAPAPVLPEEAPAAPPAPPAPDEPVVVPAAAEAGGRGEPSAAVAVPAGAVGEPAQSPPPTAHRRAARVAGPASAESGADPGMTTRTVRRFFERSALTRESGTPPAAARGPGAARGGAAEEPPGLSLGTAALAGMGALAALVALAALAALAAALPRLRSRSSEPQRRAGRRDSAPSVVLASYSPTAPRRRGVIMNRVLRRGQLGHARPAHAAAPVLADATGRAAEDARRPRTAEDDRLIPHGDLEWIPLRESEALADLDRDDDPAQLVEVPDDARRRLATTVVANPRAHRVRRHQSSRCRRPERFVAR